MTAPVRRVGGEVFSRFLRIRRVAPNCGTGVAPPWPAGGRALLRPGAGPAGALALFSETGSADTADSRLGGLERN